ncbi:PAS domain-containing protein [Tardiphaga sp. P9-11]|jgi:PAS domain S-box-containing protein|uniref:PAS domain-containing protein n=1 Tax=Tardiphaga sp. P9-11 TaxID=2024614 RepID=UPI0011F22536|nr:PAS domain-containing protein [Tardiphaga sp. P9-11]KAA0074040.1 PAS domain-containing protein [Tardiphaga sp. P9-11]
MNNADFQLRGVGDARLAVHATSNQPVWLWSRDGTRVLWANPVGARLFGARNAADLFARTFGPADTHRRQIAQLGSRLPTSGAMRLERLRGFGAALGSLMTCACSQLEFPDGGSGILVVAAEPLGGRGMPLVERLQNLVEGIDTPIAAFARDGLFVGANEMARALLGFRNLSDAGLDHARDGALKDGRIETPIGFGRMVLQRVGSGADVGLVALIAPGAVHPAPSEEELEAPTKPEASVELQSALAEPSDLFVEFDQAPGAKDPSENAIDIDAPIEPEKAEIDRDVHLEEMIAETIAHADAPTETDAQSPAVEAVADQPASVALPEIEPRTTPLRFVWQIDAEKRFTLNSDEFIHLIGPRTAASFGHKWNDLTAEFNLDPDSHVVKAMATQQTWSGITLLWPVDGGGRLPVELSGLPLFDRERNFTGYRGFGVCRDLDGMTRLAEQRRHDHIGDPPPRPLSADVAQAGPVGDSLDEPIALNPIPEQTSPPTTPDSTVQPPENVVPFRPGDPRSPALTPVENSAFNELARQLSARLESETGLITSTNTPEADSEPDDAPMAAQTLSQPTEAASQAAWLTTPPAAPRGEMMRDKMLLDLMPVGVLIYRLDRLLFANPAFLARMNYPSLNALEEAGGLDALYVGADVSTAASTSDDGTAVTITGGDQSGNAVPAEARLYTISWDNEPAHALIFSPPKAEPVAAPVTIAAPVADTLLPAGHIDAEDLATILDTTAEGVIMFDAEGNINSCNRSAEALFGYSGELLTQRNVTDLFAAESRRVVQDYLESVKESGVASLMDHGREALGQVRAGGLVPLSMTMGCTRSDGWNFFAVFRDLTQTKKTETELLNARRQADRAATAKADVLARISHEVRTPLNAIIGFAEVMVDQRFGPLGNERYIEYMKDIRASGERVIAIVNDLLDLSRIETGKIDLAFTTQNLNEMVEQCVAVMQPQANRGRIIIRTSLAHLLPTVVADARALRQITLNLIGNSIHLANAGGQVIVSTALSDFGEIVLRVRDTGHGLNDNELAAAMEPFRSSTPADSSESSGVSLSLTKALVEANNARFQIKTAPSSGTLIEVAFSNAAMKA